MQSLLGMVNPSNRIPKGLIVFSQQLACSAQVHSSKNTMSQPLVATSSRSLESPVHANFIALPIGLSPVGSFLIQCGFCFQFAALPSPLLEWLLCWVLCQRWSTLLPQMRFLWAASAGDESTLTECDCSRPQKEKL